MVPETVPEKVRSVIISIKGTIGSNAQTITPLANTVSGLASSNEELNANVESLKQIASLIEAKLVRRENLNNDLSKKANNLQACSMRNDIIINFDNKSKEYSNDN